MSGQLSAMLFCPQLKDPTPRPDQPVRDGRWPESSVPAGLHIVFVTASGMNGLPFRPRGGTYELMHKGRVRRFFPSFTRTRLSSISHRHSSTLWQTP
jgi:hypothetical protein